MANKKEVQIKTRKNKFHDNTLDVWGRDFNFDHQKGLSEWIKNSADAYIRYDVQDKDQHVVISFNDSDNKNIRIECLDFVGMTSADIDEAFQWWGDPNAAKRGKKKQTYGGHGNGGKFYMRQMFNDSYFITYRDGKMSIFGFNKKKNYGYIIIDDKEMKDVPISPDEAILFAKISDIIPEKISKLIKKNKTGFTVVKGFRPYGAKKKINTSFISSKLQNHPQARRVLMRIPVAIYYNGKLYNDRLRPAPIESKQGFEKPVEIAIPREIFLNVDGENKKIKMSTDKYPAGKLILKTSNIALERSIKFSDLNRVDILGELSVIASYKITELGIRHYTQAVFIYGECQCPILESPEAMSVSNDRVHLIENDTSKALIEWIRLQIDELAEKIMEQEKEEQKNIDKKLSSKYNDFLNDWKNQFMSKVFSSVLAGPGEGRGAGSKGDDFWNGDGKIKNPDNKKPKVDNSTGTGDKEKKGQKFPAVRLSSFDDDPLNPGSKIYLDKRQPVVYQRADDITEGIYWINTSSPLAAAIIERYGANHMRWRDFLFQRYVDIFIKEALIKMEKTYSDNFNADSIDGEIMGTLISKIHEAAAQDLEGFLFDDKYEPKK
jgi:hypothetical protein